MLLLLPQLILSFLGVLLLGYGGSLIARTRATAKWRKRPRNCPECRREWVPGAIKCGACGHEAPDTTEKKAGAWRFAGYFVAVLGFGMFLGALYVHDMLRDEASFDWRDDRAFELGPVLVAGMALSLLGLWVLIRGYRGQRARGRRRCPKCWYLIDAAVGMKCSECGHEARRERELFRPRRQWRLVLLGVLIVAIGQLGWLETRVRRGGWVAAVPTEVLILGMPWLPETWVLGEESYFSRAPDHDVDWSLVGRIYDEWDDTHAWAWHTGFSRWRAEGLIRPQAAPESILRALVFSVGTEDMYRFGRFGDEEPRTLSAEQQRAMVLALLWSMDRTDERTLDAAGRLSRRVEWPAEEADVAWLRGAIEPSAERIVQITGDAAHPNRDLAIGFAWYLEDRPGLIEALQSAANDGERTAFSALVDRADSSPPARAFIISSLRDPARAGFVATLIAVSPPEHPDIAAMPRALLMSDDPSLQRAGAIAAWRYEPAGGDVEDRIAQLIEETPELASWLVGPLHRIEGAIERRLPLFMGFSRSPDATTRRVAVSAFDYLLSERQRTITKESELSGAQRAALVRLREIAAGDPDEEVRQAAEWSIPWLEHDLDTEQP